MTIPDALDLAGELGNDGPAISPLKRGGKIGSMAAISPWRLIGGKLLRQKVAMAAGIIILLLYLVGLFAEFLAPSLPDTSRPQYTFAPPQGIGLFIADPDGGRTFQLHVNAYSVTIDKAALRRIFVPDPRKPAPIGFFVKGPAYKLWGLIPLDRHFIGPINPADPMYLLGADRLGRDVFSRLIYGTRVSMSIGLAGVAISLLLGVVLGAHLGILWRLGGHAHPTPHRGGQRHAHHSALARAGRRHSAHLVAAACVFHHHRHRLAARLDQPRA